MPKKKDGQKGAAKGMMMILSPAKTLDLSPLQSSFDPTDPSCDAVKTKVVALAMKKHGEKKLGKLLNVSPKLAETAHKYWSEFEADASKRNPSETKSALFAFSGAAYQGLQASTCSEESIRYMQSNLRIIDPLYGCLRPLDLIQPYRLEMATKNALEKKDMGDSKSLAEWWKESVTASISDELTRRKGKVVVNLASDEYSAAVDPSSLPGGSRFIKIVFQQEGRVISVHAKRARGLMVRYIAEQEIEDVDGIKGFDVEGYGFVDDRSSDDALVFDREKQPSPAEMRKATRARKSADDVPTKAKTGKRARTRKGK